MALRTAEQQKKVFYENGAMWGEKIEVMMRNLWKMMRKNVS